MKKRMRVTSLLLSLSMILALMPTALAATVVDRVKVSMTAPTVGKPLPQNLKTSSDSSAELTGFQWAGELDGDGNMMGGTNYTLTFSLKIKSGKSTAFPKNNSTLRVVFNGTLTATITEMSGTKASGTLTFFINERGRMEKPAVKKNFAWSKAEADAAYPLGSPITLLVNEETLKDTYIEEYKPFLTNGAIIRSVYGPSGTFYTLEGETIDNKSLPKISTSTTVSHYRITRVVYDYYRADDPSLGRFPNCTELWLSPRCDIDGILKSLGNVVSYQNYQGDFIRENCTVFIPDSLYPNGPAYTNSKAPGCKVMLYSGSDVYAAARAGKSAARDWCTNHSYTYPYISEDRRCTYPTCQTDAKFYYSCSKCGKCERDPSHTFYPTVGSFDNGEDGGLHTAHSFVNKVVTDEHFLGLNPNGDRVYLYVCENCGKDRRQAASSSEKKFWVADGTGAYYNFALSKTVVGKGNGYDTYAISNSSYIAAKQHAWATGEVLAASEAGLIDKAIMGSDYTGSINRLQFSSIAVKLAEKMAGKTIAPAPSGTFTDTDNEYVRKAAAAGITSGVGGGRFDPNGTLTRQQMAAFLYRALQWVKNNSDTEYTVYESKLGDYTDAGQLAGWAKEPMAFMNALGLVGGTSNTTLSPNSACTIEQAIAVASRSLYADRTGWYQKNSSGSDWLVYGTRVWVYYKNGQACYRNPYGFELTGVTFDKGLRPIKDR